MYAENRHDRSTVRIGLLGLGTVGRAFADMVHRAPGREVSIVRACVRDLSKERSAAAFPITAQVSDILNDPTIDIVVELTDDACGAYEIVATALRRGRSVVTANKRLVAEHFVELQAIAESSDVQLRYEAAVCAGIPILHLLDSYYVDAGVTTIEGVLNGSTQYILSCMENRGFSLESAIEDAQRLGYLEADPSLDISGRDTRYKLSILIAHAFGVVIPPGDITCRGLESVTADDIAAASREGLRIRLLAHAGRTPDGIVAWVAPALLDRSHPLSSLRDENNGIVVSNPESYGKHLLVGPGAGGAATASAVLADVRAIVENRAQSIHPCLVGVEPLPVTTSMTEPSGGRFLRC